MTTKSVLKILPNSINTLSDKDFNLQNFTLKNPICYIILFYNDTDYESREKILNFNRSSYRIPNVKFGVVNISENPKLSELLKTHNINTIPATIVFKEGHPEMLNISIEDIDEYALMLTC